VKENIIENIEKISRFLWDKRSF